MDNKIDVTKPVRTIDGREVTQVHIIANRIVGNVEDQMYFWSLDGQYLTNNSAPLKSHRDSNLHDIVNFPEPKYVWINVHENGGVYVVGNSYEERDAANCTLRSMGISPRYILKLNVDTGETVTMEWTQKKAPRHQPKPVTGRFSLLGTASR